MIKTILENNIRVIYKKISGSLTSIAIGFTAGANCEKRYNKGTAHALEHLLYKRTEGRSEEEINSTLDEVFALNNAMTNYPYAIYYGTTRNGDFSSALEILSDILLRPALLEADWEEERRVILQELREWSEDIPQYCEDRVLHNSFKKRRLRDLIIGSEKDLNNLCIEEIRAFYKNYYRPDNCVIAIVTSLDYDESLAKIKEYFDFWELPKDEIDFCEEEIEVLKQGYYEEKLEGYYGARLNYIFDIGRLNKEEAYAIMLYNEYLSGGVSSSLYDEIRTKRGLVYDISSTFKGEKGIGILEISLSTSKENVMKVRETIDNLLENHYNKGVEFDIKRIQKRLSMKKALDTERSIVLAHRLCTYEVMYSEGERLIKEVEGDYNVTLELLNKALKKVLLNKGVQLIY